MKTRVALSVVALAIGVFAVLVSSACSSTGPSSPSPPPTVPAAALSTKGNLTFPTCSFGLCSYQGELLNAGSGCAINVRGVTRLINSAGTQIAVDDWALPSSQKVRPNETVLYGDSYAFRETDVSTVGTYRTDPSWDNTPC